MKKLLLGDPGCFGKLRNGGTRSPLLPQTVNNFQTEINLRMQGLRASYLSTRGDSNFEESMGFDMTTLLFHPFRPRPNQPGSLCSDIVHPKRGKCYTCIVINLTDCYYGLLIAGKDS